MQSSRVVLGVLTALVSMPAFLVGHLFRQGDSTMALKLMPASFVVVILAAAIMHLRSAP